MNATQNIPIGETGFLASFETQLGARRPEFVAGAIACRAAVLHPEDGLGLSEGLRNAVVARVFLRSAAVSLAGRLPQPAEPDLILMATGQDPIDPQLKALARHTDMIATDPARAGRPDLEALLQAGYSVPQTIAISELLAYACFAVRIEAGFALLEENA